jgi:general secretion pathway protein C
MQLNRLKMQLNRLKIPIPVQIPIHIPIPKLLKAANYAIAGTLVLAFLLLMRDVVSLVFFKTPGEEGQSVKAGEVPLRSERKGLLAYAPVLKNNVFGFPAGELTPLSGRSPAAPAVAGAGLERIKLVGVVAWTDGFGYAFVEGVSPGQELYKTGDEIAGIGRLAKVESTKVFVESGGRMLEVPLQEIKSGAVSGQAPPPGPQKGRFPAGPAAGNGFARMTSKNSFVIDQKAIDESLGNPKRIMTDARLLPRMVDGEQEGFIIREVRRGGIYASLGLKNGDILLSVNKFKLANPETALQAFTALKGMDKVELDILRSGEKMTLTYEIR